MPVLVVSGCVVPLVVVNGPTAFRDSVRATIVPDNGTVFTEYGH
jgi:hypothetical protein